MPKYYDQFKTKSGIAITHTTDFVARYSKELRAVSNQADLDEFLCKWEYLCPEIRGKSMLYAEARKVIGNIKAQDELIEKIDKDKRADLEVYVQLVCPMSLFDILYKAQNYVVPQGTVFIQMLNAGVAQVDKDGYVTYHYPPKIESVTKLTDQKWLNLYLAKYTLRGKQLDWIYAARSDRPGISSQGDAVIVVPFIGSGEHQKALLIKEYRVPIQTYEYHFPAGLLNPGADVVEEARRELLEETGYDIDRVAHVTPPLVSSAGLSNETARMVFCAAVPAQEQQLEAAECIIVEEVSREEARWMLRESQFTFAAKAYPVLLAWSEGHNYV